MRLAMRGAGQWRGNIVKAAGGVNQAAERGAAAIYRGWEMPYDARRFFYCYFLRRLYVF